MEVGFFRTLFSKELKSTALNQMWRLVTGPLLIILLPIFLSEEVQGFWYLMISLGAVAAFADFGFSNILLQFSAHEFAFLKFDSSFDLDGNEVNLRRLASLFIFALKWTVVLILILFPITLFVGIFVMGGFTSLGMWTMPWLIYCIGAVLTLSNGIFLSFFEGCNSVSKVQAIRLRIALVNTSLVTLGLIMDFGLYALSISLLVSSVFGLINLYLVFKITVNKFFDVARINRHGWGLEIYPLLRKYIISWTSGYLIFQLFTPFAFYFFGAVEAGKVGMSIAIFTSIFSISNVWTTSVIPEINIAIAKLDFEGLHRIFNKYLIMAVWTYLIGSIIFYFLFFMIKTRYPFMERFVSLQSLVLLNVCWFAQLIVHNLAIYLRAYKEEPLLVPSILSALFVVLTTLIAANYLSEDLFFIGFATMFFWFLPWVIILYRRKVKLASIKL